MAREGLLGGEWAFQVGAGRLSDGFSVGRPLTSISQPISRVLYGVLPAGRTRDGHSSGTPVTRRLKQPTRAADPDTDLGDCSPAPSLFGFAPGGVCRAVSVAENAVRSYRTLSPLPRHTQRPRRSALCGTFPEICPAFTGTTSLRSASACAGRAPPDVIRHRTSMEPGLSSTAAFRPLPQRPSGRLTSLEVVANMDCVKPEP